MFPLIYPKDVLIYDSLCYTTIKLHGFVSMCSVFPRSWVLKFGSTANCLFFCSLEVRVVVFIFTYFLKLTPWKNFWIDLYLYLISHCPSPFPFPLPRPIGTFHLLEKAPPIFSYFLLISLTRVAYTSWLGGYLLRYGQLSSSYTLKTIPSPSPTTINCH